MEDQILLIFPIEEMRRDTQLYQKLRVSFGSLFGHPEETAKESYQHTRQTMEKSENIVRYTAEELQTMREQGLSQTDFARISAMTEEELQKTIENDPDAALTPENWDSLIIDPPLNKKSVPIKIDADVIAWFKSRGKGYQTRINSVLRTYMKAHKNRDNSR